MGKKIRVLVIDDSAVVRQTLSHILTLDPKIEVMGTAHDPLIAEEKIRKERPDVITLDIEMPRMDGLTFLQKIMSEAPIPVVICSCLAEDGSDVALKAMELGAVEIIHKPRLGPKKALEESTIRICEAVKDASVARMRPVPKIYEVRPKYSADVIIHKRKTEAMIKTTDKVVLIGASTGGTEAIKIFLEELPHNAPGIVVVQHMPELFTRSFADRLDELCRVRVKEAENQDSVIQGRVLIAPGNYHTLIKRSGARYFVEIAEGPLVNHHRPSIDVLFRSAARYAGKNAIGVILTGMGNDGTQGMSEMKEAGAYTIAQNEETSVVFGMPREAINRGCVDKVIPLEGISKEIIKKCS
jgi:two-component system chemotaxis response regulator CheB